MPLHQSWLKYLTRAQGTRYAIMRESMPHRHKHRAEQDDERGQYKSLLRPLQIELVKIQKHIIAHDHKVLIILEGRDAGGKDGTIKRIVEHLSPRDTRSVALGKPTEHDQDSWYFQRYVPHLPAAREMVLFNRSWYNRAGVEWVMGYCTKAEYARFPEEVLAFEQMLIGSGVQILKYYLDIGKSEQRARLKSRRTDPLKQWKTSEVDESALKHFDDYSKARDEMLAKTSSSLAPWRVVHADDKRLTRLNVIRDILMRLACPQTDKHLATPDANIVFTYEPAHTKAGELAA
jgi:polyphosphate kinase 2